MNDLEETKTQKVNAMLAIRKMVKDHITGKNKGNVPYLAKLDLSPADNTRMVIALQDLVDDERGRHARARKHIVELSGMIEQLKTSCVQISNAAYDSAQRLKAASQRILDQNVTIADLHAKLKTKDDVINGLMQMKWEQEAAAKALAPTMGEAMAAAPQRGQWQAVGNPKERG